MVSKSTSRYSDSTNQAAIVRRARRMRGGTRSKRATGILTLIAVPCALHPSQSSADVTFELNVLTNPEAEYRVSTAWSEHEGDLRRTESSISQYGDYCFVGDGDTMASQAIDLTDYASFISAGGCAGYRHRLAP